MKRKILIVDDEQAIADLVEVYLSNEGMEVLKCYNGKDALDCIRKEELSLAILDVMLPDIDGYKLCQEKMCIRDSHTRMAMMTASGMAMVTYRLSENRLSRPRLGIRASGLFVLSAIV